MQSPRAALTEKVPVPVHVHLHRDWKELNSDLCTPAPDAAGSPAGVLRVFLSPGLTSAEQRGASALEAQRA